MKLFYSFLKKILFCAFIAFTINNHIESGAVFEEEIELKQEEIDEPDIEIKHNRGNENASNSCFMNSVIQALYHLQPFRKFLNNNQDLYDDKSVPRALFDLINTMEDSSKNFDETEPINPSEFRQTFANCSTEQSIQEMEQGQHDAIEFYCQLIDRCWLETTEMQRAKNTFLAQFNDMNGPLLWDYISSQLSQNILLYGYIIADEILANAIVELKKSLLAMIEDNNRYKDNKKIYSDQITHNWPYINDDLKAAIVLRNHKMMNVMGSSIQQTLECNQCGQISIIKQKSSPWIWPLVMENFEPAHTLLELMMKSGSWKCNAYDCQNSFIDQPSQQATTKLLDPPSILAIQFGRFAYPYKINQLFDIPETLFSDETTIHWNGNFYYKLYAIVVQKGEMDSGHYWTYARDDNNEWYCYNDMVEETQPDLNAIDPYESSDFSNIPMIPSGKFRSQKATNNEMRKILNPPHKTPEAAIEAGVEASVWVTPYILFYVKTNNNNNNDNMFSEEKEETPGDETPGREPEKTPADQIVIEQENGKDVKIIPTQNDNASIVEEVQDSDKQQNEVPANPNQSEQNQVNTEEKEQSFFSSVITTIAQATQWTFQTLWSLVSSPFRWLFGS